MAKRPLLGLGESLEDFHHAISRSSLARCIVQSPDCSLSLVICAETQCNR